jgi:hypothetical protein
MKCLSFGFHKWSHGTAELKRIAEVTKLDRKSRSKDFPNSNHKHKEYGAYVGLSGRPSDNCTGY